MGKRARRRFCRQCASSTRMSSSARPAVSTGISTSPPRLSGEGEAKGSRLRVGVKMTVRVRGRVGLDVSHTPQRAHDSLEQLAVPLAARRLRAESVARRGDE
eukprot:scaffold77475_cov72-Phaeocystis_antarctica.AAC.7